MCFRSLILPLQEWPRKKILSYTSYASILLLFSFVAFYLFFCFFIRLLKINVFSETIVICVFFLYFVVCLTFVVVQPLNKTSIATQLVPFHQPSTVQRCKVARTDKSYPKHVLCTYLRARQIGLSIPESSRTNPTPDNFVFNTII